MIVTCWLKIINWLKCDSRGLYYQEKKRYDESIYSYLKAIECRPKLTGLFKRWYLESILADVLCYAIHQSQGFKDFVMNCCKNDEIEHNKF